MEACPRLFGLFFFDDGVCFSSIKPTHPFNESYPTQSNNKYFYWQESCEKYTGQLGVRGMGRDLNYPHIEALFAP